jgi:nuclear receptor subfamily 1 group I
MKMSKKSINAICAVCSDRAIGFNYDVLSCGPCKAFFRRNAHQNLVRLIFYPLILIIVFFQEKLKCVTGENQCSVEYEIRRKCTRCRLNRCFAVGMRKDFIMSEEELQLKRKRLEEIRNVSSTSESINVPSSNILSESDVLSETLNEIDHVSLSIQNIFL